MEISGLVSTKNGYVAVADGSADGSEVLEVFDLDTKCQVTERHSFQRNPFDPEDLAVSKDGTLWVADTGDNKLERETVALWKISPDRNQATIHRLTYPDGRHDAEALLIQPDGKPVIVTKDLNGGGVSGIYIANTPLQADKAVPLTKVGEFKVSNTGTGGNRFGAVGQRLVTGAALSADGTRAVVRTYADAYEWKVTGGNVVAALTKGKPVRTPLPGEPQGEAITFSQDGKTFVTATEATTTSESPRMFSYTPAKPPPPSPKGVKPAAKSGWFDGLELQDMKLIIAGFGLLGLVMVFLGIWGIQRARGPGGPEGGSRRPRDPDDVAPGERRGSPRGRATVRTRSGPDAPGFGDDGGWRPDQDHEPRGPRQRRQGGYPDGRTGRAAVPAPGAGRGPYAEPPSAPGPRSAGHDGPGPTRSRSGSTRSGSAGRARPRPTHEPPPARRSDPHGHATQYPPGGDYWPE
ncbi:MAG: hypothetical protein ACRDT6_13910 [Micromonosporaceae bacterium]